MLLLILNKGYIGIKRILKFMALEEMDGQCVVRDAMIPGIIV